MKKLALLASLLFLIAARCAAQGQRSDTSNPLGGDIRASSTNCSVASSCVWMKLPANATSLSITVANGPVGSYTGTLQFEQSADGGFTFVSASPASTATTGVFTFTVTTFTDFRVRASAFASGDASVNMQASGPATGPPGPAGPPGSSGGISSVPVLPGTCTVGTGFILPDNSVWTCGAGNTYVPSPGRFFSGYQGISPKDPP